MGVAKEHLTVVGIDPGIANVGLGAVREIGRTPHLLGHHIIQTSSTTPHTDRLYAIRTEVQSFIRTHEPNAIAIEAQYFYRQNEVAFRVGGAVGVILLTAREANIPVFEYGPPQVKQAVVGSGRASKDQVAYMVKALLNVARLDVADHASDALAIALAHLNQYRLRGQIEAAGYTGQ